jgi:hypothetical protein
MKRRSRLAAWLGLDGNELRRRTDRFAAWGKAGLLAAFIAGTPAASVVVGHVAYREFTVEQHQEQAWRQVSAVVSQSVPANAGIYGGGSWVWATWTAPSGHPEHGMIPVTGGEQAGSRVPIWVDAAGQLQGHPLSHNLALLRVGFAVAGVPIGLAVLLVLVAATGRWLLERRRMADWEADWASAGPRLTRDFWARG